MKKLQTAIIMSAAVWMIFVVRFAQNEPIANVIGFAVATAIPAAVILTLVFLSIRGRLRKGAEVPFHVK